MTARTHFHPLLQSWPTDQVITPLVASSSGELLYSATSASVLFCHGSGRVAGAAASVALLGVGVGGRGKGRVGVVESGLGFR